MDKYWKIEFSTNFMKIKVIIWCSAFIKISIFIDFNAETRQPTLIMTEICEFSFAIEFFA